MLARCMLTFDSYCMYTPVTVSNGENEDAIRQASLLVIYHRNYFAI